MDRARAEGRKVGRARITAKTEQRIRTLLAQGQGILRVARTVKVGTGTVQRVKRTLAEAH